MKQNKLTLVVMICIGLLAGSAGQVAAVSPADLAEAARMIEQARKLMKRHSGVEIPLPQPIGDSSGKFVSPYTSDGRITDWATKSLTAQAVSQVAGKAAKRGLGKFGSKFGLGGLAAKKATRKAESASAIAAMGGWDFIRESSDISFDTLDELAVYLHAAHGQDSDHEDALAATMAVYPKLKSAYRPAVDRAYRDAKRSR